MNPHRELVVKEALSWVRTPYHHAADVKGLRGGVDCAMLLVRVYADLGLIPPIDPRPYPAQWYKHRDSERYLGWVAKYGHQVVDPQPGDILTYKFGRVVSHASIVVDDNDMVHSCLGQGCVRSERRAYADRFVSAWSIFK